MKKKTSVPAKIFQRERVTFLRKNFFGREKSRDFCGGGFFAVGRVTNVVSDDFFVSKIATNRSRRRVSRFRRTEQFSHFRDRVFAFQNGDDNGARFHPIGKKIEIRFVDQMRVVSANKHVVDLNHFARGNREPSRFKTGENRSREIFFHAIRFKDDERFLNHWK